MPQPDELVLGASIDRGTAEHIGGTADHCTAYSTDNRAASSINTGEIKPTMPIRALTGCDANDGARACTDCRSAKG